jgi:hypothetical protein
MIRAVNGWHAVWAALLFLLPRNCSAADDLSAAARELASKTVAFLGARGPVTVSYRNRSSLPESQLEQIRSIFESTVPASGPAPEGAQPDIRLTLSENAGQYLLVEEARKQEESQTWIAAWNRTLAANEPVPSLSLERKLIWEQSEPILDLAVWDTGMVVLSPSRVTLYRRQGNQWMLRQEVQVPLAHPSPRDPRGRLRRNGTRLEVFLPGIACQGDAADQLSLSCRPSMDPWVLESGKYALLLAHFVADRDYFDGNVVLQDGTRKMLAPFYSMAAAEDAGGTLWLLAQLDGQTELFNAAWETVAAIPSWGSDLLGVNGSCGVQVLATRPGGEGISSGQPDALQAFAIASHATVPASAPLPFAGAITALWPASSSSATVVVHDSGDRNYLAYVVTLVCGS